MPSIDPHKERRALRSEELATDALDSVARAIARLRYGAIELRIHDGRVVQLDVTERQRFE